MKKLFLLIAVFVVLVMVAGPVLAESAGIKIGYVDLRKAYFDYEKRKTMEKELEGVAESHKVEHEKMIAEIKTMTSEYELLSDAAKVAKEKQIEAKKIQLDEFVKNVRQEYLTKQNDMFRDIIEDIEKVTQDIGKQDGYDYIFDSRNVMYGKDTYDLTEKVLKELNGKPAAAQTKK